MDRNVALVMLAIVATAALFELAHHGVIAARAPVPWRARLALWWSGTAAPLILGALLVGSPILAGILLAD